MSTAEMKLEWQVLSSLEKVFPDSEIKSVRTNKTPVFAGARGETIAFQIAFRFPLGVYLNLKLKSELENIRMREVCLVPCELPGAHDDPGILRSAPGLYPDPLRPLGARGENGRPAG